MSNEPTPFEPSRDSFGARFEWLLLLAALVVVVLVYPLRLDDSLLVPLTTWWNQGTFLGRLVRDQFEPFLAFLLSPLVLKGALAGMLLVAFSAVRIARLALQTAPLAAQGRSAAWAWVSLLAFMVWAIASFFWSPVPDIALAACYWVLTYGVALFLIFRRGLTPCELRRLAGVLMALGTLVMAVLFLQALPIFRGLIFKLMMRFDDARNVYGSLLGHNTAAASFLLLTAFPALGLMLTAPRRRVRVACGVYLAAFLLSIVLLQSRSVWALAPLLGFLALRTAVRAMPTARRTLRVVSALLLLALTGALLSQTIDRPWNPFYVRENALVTRLRGIAENGIAGESRVRLNVIGATLVARSPLIGHGLESYAYVYPRRQGEFFVANPTTSLNRTTRRSDMAHNEYMQVAIDQGLIGLGLMLAFLVEVWRRGRRLAGTLPTEDALLHRMFGWSALAFGLHALFDFPMHVPQIALPGFLCMAAWGSLRTSAINPSEATETTETPILSGAPASAFRLEPFARLLTAMLVVGLIPVAVLPYAKALQADALFNRGQALNAAFAAQHTRLSPSQRQQVLDDSTSALQRALQMQPDNAMAAFRLAEAYQAQGELARAAALAIERQTGEPAPVERALAGRFYDAAIDMTRVASRNMVYHELDFLRAKIFERMMVLDPLGGHGEQYEQALEATLRLTPHHPDAPYKLAEYLSGLPGSDPQVILQLRRLAYFADPKIFITRYIEPINLMNIDQRYDTSARAVEQILPIRPDIADWVGLAALSNLLAGNAEAALAHFARLKQADPHLYEAGYMGTLDVSLLSGDWQGALDDLHSTYAWVASNPPTPDPQSARSEGERLRFEREQDLRQDFIPLLRVEEQECRRRLGLADSETVFTRPQTTPPKEWDARIAEIRPFVLRTRFRDFRAALDAVQERITLPGMPSAKFYVEAVYCARAAGQAELAARYLTLAAEADPKHPALNDLRRALGIAPAPAPR